MILKRVKSLFKFGTIEIYEYKVNHKLPSAYKNDIAYINGGKPINKTFIETDNDQNIAFKTFLSFNKEDKDSVWDYTEWDTEKKLSNYVPIALDYNNDLICISKRDGTIVLYKREDNTTLNLANSYAAFIEMCDIRFSSYELANKRFGLLEVIDTDEKEEHSRYTVWNCRCDCGNLVKRNYFQLVDTHKKTQSCGCQANILDLTGHTYGKVHIIKRTNLPYWNGRVMWECECECGNIIYADTKTVRFNDEYSCGCNKKRTSPIYELKNRRFGKLVAIEVVKGILDNNNHRIWYCRCDCGGEIKVSADDLKSGMKNNCGCER